MIELNDLIKHEDSNILEIYLINNFDKVKIDLDMNNIKIEKIMKKYKFKNSIKYKTYFKKNLMYTYELENDNQYVSEKILTNHKIIDNKLGILVYNEHKNATHVFGCTNDIDNIIEYQIYESKINNRISLNIKKQENKNQVYIQYKHSKNVETEKIENIINSIIKNILY
tara:strand:+ start:153 stop:659 length:507 start_codon:yes stop_codon:yes gene_type:complete